MIDRIFEGLTRAIEHALAVAFVFAVCLTFANVIGRYAIGRSILGADEVQICIMVCMAFLGAVVVSWRRQHLRMDVLVKFFPLWLQTFLRAAELALVVVLAGLVNRNFMKSLGPELEAIVRDEARKAEGVFSNWGVDEVGRIQKNWEQNGGQTISLAPAQATRYVEDVTAAIVPLLAKNPQHGEDYEALLAASKKHRK